MSADGPVWRRFADRHPYLLAGAEPRPGAPVLVVVHGISRNAAEQARAFHEAARKAGTVLLAPLFARDSCPDYQCLGRRGLRADLLLEGMLAELAARYALAVERFHLFGFSGGAQFAHRYALAYPDRIRTLTLAAAGWYTWLTQARRFPYGLAPHPRLADLRFDAAAFLQLPLRLFVGERDVEADPHLRRHPWLDRRQGIHRRERAHRWIAHLRRTAAALGLRPDLRLEELAGCGHDFRACVRRGGLAHRLSEVLQPACEGVVS